MKKATNVIIVAVVIVGAAVYFFGNELQTGLQEPQTNQVQPIAATDGARGQCQPTGHDVQGPFYLEDAPFRTNLAPPDDDDDKLIVRGKVFDTNCTPLAGAIVDIWHTDANGDYDSSADYWYRGKVKTEIDGSFEFLTYKFETVRPGRYPLGDGFRPAHIHIKASFPEYKLLTTQLYFSDDPYLAPNDPCASCRSDDPTHIIDLDSGFNEEGYKTWEGTFDIVLERGSTIIEENSSY